MADAAELDPLWEDHREFFAVWNEELIEANDRGIALLKAAEQGEPLHELAARYREAVKTADAAEEAFRKSYERTKESEIFRALYEKFKEAENG